MRFKLMRWAVWIGPFACGWDPYSHGRPHFVKSVPWGRNPHYTYSLYLGRLYLGIRGRVLKDRRAP